VNRILRTAAAMIIAVAVLVQAPAARAEGAVTYDIFSDTVGGLAGVEVDGRA